MAKNEFLSLLGDGVEGLGAAATLVQGFTNVGGPNGTGINTDSKLVEGAIAASIITLAIGGAVALAKWRPWSGRSVEQGG